VAARALLVLILACFLAGIGVADAASGDRNGTFPLPLESYHDDNVPSLEAKLAGRIATDPFNLIATGIFLLAIVHTFFASKFLKIAHDYRHRYDVLADRDEREDGYRVARQRDSLQFRATLFHFLGEIEAIFGIWLIPLGIAIVVFKGWNSMVHYVDGVNFTEPIFVFVIMAIASSRPILFVAEKCLALVASIGKGTPAAWWLSILTLGPILGSFITEPAAMTISAMLLGERFYKLKPGKALAYATLGLLFVNVSIGGTFTHFAAPPVVMVATKWQWSLEFMMSHFGWKAALSILGSNLLVLAIFSRELLAMKANPEPRHESNDIPIPWTVTVMHLLAVIWTVLVAHHPALVLLGLLFFLAYVKATERHQFTISLRGPMLVGFFLASLVIHGGCQQWWIAPVLGGLGEWPLFGGAVLLTAFNDNAAITYLATLVPNFSDALEYAVVAGAVVGGGLTVIANAPNPAGQSLLQKHFGPGGVNPLGLLAGALGPTLIAAAAFMLLR